MKIAMLGLGAYSIALTKVLSLNHENEIVMWSKFEDEVNMLKNQRENQAVLPSIKIDENIVITNDLKQCIDSAEIIILAVPMLALRSMMQSLKEIIEENQILVIVSKGVEKGTYMFPTQVIEEELKDQKVCMISGPSFAIELASYAETGLTIASSDKDLIKKVEKAFSNSNVFFDETEDILGVQICATVKNIYAILLGMLEGMNKSESTKASVLKTIINDSRHLLELLGGNRKTAYMYAGLGDLLLTCMSSKSRNYTLGMYLGKGYNLDDALNQMSAKTVEGLHSLDSIYELLKLTGNEIKSINFMYDVIYNNLKVDEVLKYIT